MTHDAIAAQIAAIIARADLKILAWDISDAIAKSENPDLDVFAMDEIEAELPAFLAGCLRRAAIANAAPDDIDPRTGLPARFGEPIRTRKGDVKHIDERGDALDRVSFGHKQAMGPARCPRCWELDNGAAPRADHADRAGKARTSAELSRAMREHFDDPDHRAKCGPVCTAFDY